MASNDLDTYCNNFNHLLSSMNREPIYLEGNFRDTYINLSVTNLAGNTSNITCQIFKNTLLIR